MLPVPLDSSSIPISGISHLKRLPDSWAFGLWRGDCSTAFSLCSSSPLGSYCGDLGHAAAQRTALCFAPIGRARGKRRRRSTTTEYDDSAMRMFYVVSEHLGPAIVLVKHPIMQFVEIHRTASQQDHAGSLSVLRPTRATHRDCSGAPLGCAILAITSRFLRSWASPLTPITITLHLHTEVERCVSK